ncbi:hypothetical protein A2J03_10720 [Rhodococcus sp. EPR-157]|uniref:DUF2742 domain-containing protein n=1 Tax=Rhodococcus sp. EPR-157 TaxID=1813677 RepID=UPI0007BB0302|nr:DUF2742 domain-containing protein [Rhodococcus sp. EPR-157]KZF01027.1 hypothetical protein A2J03_10720 [Rhodococcus sp. EPR-157]
MPYGNNSNGTSVDSFVSALIGGPVSHEVDVVAVHERLAPILAQAVRLGDIPILGSPAWVGLPEDDSRWRHSVVAAGYRWAIREWLDQDVRRSASRAISAADDWGSVAQSIRRRNEYFTENPWAQRVVA